MDKYLDEKFLLVRDKIKSVLISDFLTFDQVSKLKNQMGVYFVYEDDEILYIGKTNKFNIRFGVDLKHETTHTLVAKLIKSGRFRDRFEVIDFLKNKCKVRIELADSNREAEAIEAMAIWLLNPVFNKS